MNNTVVPLSRDFVRSCFVNSSGPSLYAHTLAGAHQMGTVLKFVPPKRSLTVLVDVDEVGYPFVDRFREFSQNWLGRYLPIPTKWNIHEEWDISLETFVQIMESWVVDCSGFSRGYEIPGYHEMIRAIQRNGHKVIIATSRGTHKDSSNAFVTEAKAQTIQWLASLGLSDVPIIFTEDKTQIKADVLVDDAVHHLDAALLEGVDVICRDAPHNRNWNGPRVYHNREILSIVERIAANGKGGKPAWKN